MYWPIERSTPTAPSMCPICTSTSDVRDVVRASMRSPLLWIPSMMPFPPSPAIAGSESIFEDPDRIAMLDETIRFDTGSDRDKALLLHVLIERVVARRGSARTAVKTVFTESGKLCGV